MVDELAALDGSGDPERNAEERAQQRAERCQFQRGGKIAGDVLDDRPRGQHRIAEIGTEHVADIDGELPPERQVEAHFLADAGIDMGGGAVADHGQHRVHRHDAADEEGHRQQPEDRDRQHQQEAAGGN